MTEPLKILLVEDSADDAELLEIELHRRGLAPVIRRVETWPAMLAALEAQDWDVVLSDYHLPEFSAEQALATLKKSGKDLPFIIISGVVQAEDVVALLKQGAHDFLNKDSLARLVPAIEREIREAGERVQRRRAEERVRILSLAIEQSPVSVVITDCDGRIEYVNPKFEEVTGFSAAESMGRMLEFTHCETTGLESCAKMWEAVRAGNEFRGEFRSLRQDGQPFWEYARVSPLKDRDGAISHFIAVKEDITIRRGYEELLLRQANFDDLTGLPNRLVLFDRLKLALALAQRSKRLVALLYIDLDRFKNVNDTLGHTAGDALLKDAAARLSACVREGDTLARMGGDEFLVVLPSMEDSGEARKVAERMVDTFDQPFTIEDKDYLITASIGITLFPEDGDDPHVLLRNADLAMYQAKTQGRNGFRFFTQEINLRLQERLALEGRLRGAVSRNEMRLHYQPIIDLRTNQPVGLEALIRWQMPDGQLCMPSEFISIAEEMGMIEEIGGWVVATACGELKEYFGEGAPLRRVAVNISSIQLRMPDFAKGIKSLLDAAAIGPSCLELEITESVLMDDLAETSANLTMLCDLGVRLSIDDFGTGYSSLSYLHRYPFNTLKIDRSFVTAALHSANAGRLIESIITMAQGLGLEVVAEGVETEEQLEFLRARGCDHVQGYLFSRPVPLPEIIAKYGCRGLIQRDTARPAKPRG